MSNKAMSSNLFWSFLERFASQGISLVISIILARLLSVNDFGVISAVQIFTSIAAVFVTGGISSALIHKRDADDLDYSSMFYYNTVFSIAVYFIVFALAPWFVEILNESYDYKLLTTVLRVSGIGFVLSSFNSFFRSRLIRNLEFKKIFFITVTGTVLSAILGVSMAFLGFGVWSLVAQSITSYAANTVLLVIFSGWHPKLCFSFTRLKPMLGYGYKLMASSLLTTVYLDANSLVIGSRYDSTALAYYNKGLSFPKIVVSNLMSAFNSVLFPTMTKLETLEENKDMVKRFNQYSCFIIFPMMAGLAAVAPTFVKTLLGEKWLPAVPFLQLACLDYALQPIGISNLQYWKASGHATLYLVTDIIKKAIGITILIIAVIMNQGVMAIAWAQVASTLVAMIISLIPQKKLLGYSALKQIKDIIPSTVLSIAMFTSVYLIGTVLSIPSALALIFQVIIGIVLYLGIAKLFHFKELQAIIDIAKNKLKKHDSKKGETVDVK